MNSRNALTKTILFFRAQFRRDGMLKHVNFVGVWLRSTETEISDSVPLYGPVWLGKDFVFLHIYLLFYSLIVREICPRTAVERLPIRRSYDLKLACWQSQKH